MKKKFSDFKPVSLLDEMLTFFAEDPNTIHGIELFTVITTIALKKDISLVRSETELVLNQLIKDGYITTKHPQIGGAYIGNRFYYAITFEGTYFQSIGGYTAKEANRLKEEKRISDLELRQAKNEILMQRLQRIIAIGTFVAAIYYIAEFIKIFWPKIFPSDI